MSDFDLSELDGASDPEVGPVRLVEAKEIAVRRMVRRERLMGWVWEAEVVLTGISPNSTTSQSLTKKGAIRKARKRWERLNSKVERVPL